MLYEKIEPGNELKHLVKEYWVYENPSAEIEEQKIIPDGFCEIVIHYGEPYMINISGKWEMQTNVLLAGQISKYFFLRNTGHSGMIGIKLFADAPHRLFNCDMSRLVDKVVPLNTITENQLVDFSELHSARKYKEKVKIINDQLLQAAEVNNITGADNVGRAVNIILKERGLVDIELVCNEVNLGMRHLERTFKKMIGVTPKFFSRIIRFSYIFELIKSENKQWLGIALQSGFFDQSHFIKNFKEFTGEEPSTYNFDEQNLANFFLNK